jgi:hypothetical protein
MVLPLMIRPDLGTMHAARQFGVKPPSKRRQIWVCFGEVEFLTEERSATGGENRQ